jgi:hypothetical protein
MFTILPSKCTRYTIIYMYYFYQLFTHLYLTIQHRKTDERKHFATKSLKINLKCKNGGYGTIYLSKITIT